MMHSKHITIRSVLPVVLCVFAIACISVFFVSQMDNTIENNTLNTISELAEHDRISIQNFIETNWNALYSIQRRFKNSGCKTLPEIQEQMSIEQACGDFNNLYLVAEDGTVYTDQSMAYPKEQMDLMQYFDDSKDQIVKRYDYYTTTKMQKETILYGVRLYNYTVDGIHFIALVGITNISQIQNKIMISSFVREGEGRGYSSVVNANGDFIVNINKTVSPNRKLNLYSLLEKGSLETGWEKDGIIRKMRDEEVFYFYFTDEENDEKLLYFMPIETTDWYFLSIVEKSVFTEQSRSFTFFSLAMLVTVIITIISILLFFIISRNKTIKTTEEVNAKNAFLSNMSHEIRTPLNGVIGLLHLMRTHVRDNDPEQMSEWIDKTHATANYLLSLVSNVLDMNKFQEGKLKLIPEPFMLEDMIDEIWMMQRGNIESKGLSFLTEKNITIPCVIGDKLRIEQVLMNILGNAAKFTLEGSIKLSVSQEQTDSHHVTTTIVCSDTGIGMSPQFLDTIWDSYSQEHNAKTSNIRGTGLGMALSKRFIDAMGGEISVKSKIDEGSTFTIVLHLEIAETIIRTPGKDIQAAQLFGDQKPLRLLVAEDNELNAEILMEILKDIGFQAVLAENGQIAVDIFAASEPGEFDYILMDIQMPVMDGCQATERIRHLNRPDARTIPIFACTANTFQEERDHAIKSGMNDFLIKPIDINILLMKLNPNISRQG